MKDGIPSINKLALTLLVSISLTSCGGSKSDSADKTSPIASNFSPANNSSNIGTLATVSASFNEDMYVQTVNANSFTLKNTANNNIASSVNFDAANNTVILSSTAELALADTYIATLSPAITDLAGNALAETSWQFTTRDGVWQDSVGITTLSERLFNPKVAIDTKGNALAVWMQEDGTRFDIWASRYSKATGWGAPTLIENNNISSAYQPQVTFDNSGNAIAIWSQSTDISLHKNIWVNRYDKNNGWGQASLLGKELNPLNNHEGNGNSLSPHIEMDQEGNAFAVWHQFDGERRDIWSSRYDKETGWRQAEMIQNTLKGYVGDIDLTIDVDGNAHAIWHQRDKTIGISSIWFNQYNKDTGWGEASLVENNDAFRASTPKITIDRDGNALAIWQQGSSDNDNIWSSRYTKDSGWSDAILLSTDSNKNKDDAEGHKLTMDKEGNAFALWSREDDDEVAILWAKIFNKNTGWGESKQIGTVESIGRAEVSFDNTGNALALWSGYIEGKSDVYAKRYNKTSGWGETQSFGSNDYIHSVDIALGSNGKAFAVWVQSKDFVEQTILAKEFK